MEDDDGEFFVNGAPVSKAQFFDLYDTCFLSGTEVFMADGGLKSIEDVVAGDRVLSYRDGGMSVDTVRSVLSYGADRMGDFYLVLNGRLRVTPNHMILVDGVFVRADEIELGDVAFNDLVVSSIARVFVKERSYDLVLESGDVYFADGFMVCSDVGSVVLVDGVGRMSAIPKVLEPLTGGTGGGSPPGGSSPPSVPVGQGRTLDPTQDCYVWEFQKDSTGGCTQKYLEVDPEYKIVNGARTRASVSYTHLRAHET